jgi:predicted ATPase
MIKELYLDNYRRFVNQKISFCDTMLIKGENGAGKTTLMELVCKLKRFIVNSDSTGHINELVTVDDLPRWLKSDYGQPETHLELKYASGETEFVYGLKIQYSLKDGKRRIFSEELSANGEFVYRSDIEKDKVDVITDDGRNFVYAMDWSHSGLLVAARVSRKIRAFISEIEHKLYVFCLEPGSTGGPEPLAGELAVSGNNFSCWYSNRLTQDIEAASDVLKSYRDFLKNCKRTFIDNKTGEFTIEEAADDKTGFEIKFSELSAGQKKLCVYYAVFKMLPRESTLFFDEFENHLSPGELQPLYDMMQEQQDEKEFQIVLVSHHHKTINWFHDSALTFSLAGFPAHVKADQEIS